MTGEGTNESAAAVTPGEEDVQAAAGPAKLTEFPELATEVEGINEELKSPGQECPQDMSGTVPGWVDTPSAQRVFSALVCAQDLGEITVIHGGTGVGKTVAARRYADTFEAVWFAEMNAVANRSRACLERVAVACRATHCGYGGADRIWTAIADRLRGICVFGGTRGLLVIDEAPAPRPCPAGGPAGAARRDRVWAGAAGERQVRCPDRAPGIRRARESRRRSRALAAGDGRRCGRPACRPADRGREGT